MPLVEHVVRVLLVSVAALTANPAALAGLAWVRPFTEDLPPALGLQSGQVPPRIPAAGRLRVQLWDLPLDPAPEVLHRFRAPPGPWAAGHRGVDLAAAVGQPVLAPRDGVVTFVGRVADRGVVVIAHPGGYRSSMEPVHPVVPMGSPARRGDTVAVVSGERSHCGRPCLHWGVRAGDRYVDPLLLIAAPPVVLLPTGGARVEGARLPGASRRTRRRSDQAALPPGGAPAGWN